MISWALVSSRFCENWKTERQSGQRFRRNMAADWKLAGCFQRLLVDCAPLMSFFPCFFPFLQRTNEIVRSPIILERIIDGTILFGVGNVENQCLAHSIGNRIKEISRYLREKSFFFGFSFGSKNFEIKIQHAGKSKDFGYNGRRLLLPRLISILFLSQTPSYP